MSGGPRRAGPGAWGSTRPTSGGATRPRWPRPPVPVWWPSGPRHPRRHPAGDEAGPDEEHADAGAGQRVRQAAGERVQAGLGRAVHEVGLRGRTAATEESTTMVPWPCARIRAACQQAGDVAGEVGVDHLGGALDVASTSACGVRTPVAAMTMSRGPSANLASTVAWSARSHRVVDHGPQLVGQLLASGGQSLLFTSGQDDLGVGGRGARRGSPGRSRWYRRAAGPGRVPRFVGQMLVIPQFPQVPPRLAHHEQRQPGHFAAQDRARASSGPPPARRARAGQAVELDQGRGQRDGAGQVPGPGARVLPGGPRQVRRDHQGADDDLAEPQRCGPVSA